jgi:hypothetical protein
MGYTWFHQPAIQFYPSSPPSFSGLGDTVIALSGPFCYFSQDKGVTFVKINSPNTSTDVLTGGFNKHGLWVSQSGFLYQSTNFGSTWRPIDIPKPANWTSPLGWLKACSISDTSIALITADRLWMGYTSKNPVLSINKPTEGLPAFSISPNPNDGHFSIETNVLQVKNVLVVNALGKVVHTGNATEVSLSLPSGIYFVTTQFTNGQQQTKRLVIQ